uniref:Zinc finger protein 770-like n=1 Tax=Sinocyclocheilus grahami TaxID=75366 RepID=A0A672MVU5_SINGR
LAQSAESHSNRPIISRNTSSSAFFSKPSESQWMEEDQENEEQKPSVLQRKNSNGNKRVHDCPVCHKRFGAPSKLKRHCLIHTDQRPFQCSICCRAFREHSHLKVHVRTHTNPVKQRTPSLQSYKERLALYTGQSSAYSSKLSESQWME